ncbi:nedd8-activating enzyme E1 regulatory subunit APP-BP1 isoform X2 [Tachypleus tridentatus]|uniref:nedd8-activating enzyme E1 regulatory subunit APP-BP1 isoform X2 n=1 Tax=Tachypleus tridentatus TaxID=6853 RepID=UPI003FD0CD00
MYQTPEHLLEENSEFFNSFSVVVATGLTEKTLLLLSSLLWEAGVPLLVCRAYGMIGYMRLQVSEHTVIETHPDNVLDDLRLDRPFPALQEYVESLNLDQMDLKDHSHTPYVALLLKYIQQWQKENNGEIPRTFNEKKAFKEMIRKGIRINEEGVPDEEENYEEAIKAVNTALNATLVPVNVQNILNDTACENLSSESKPFWIMARALRDFVENEGKGALPVRGTIPDMTADSERYIKLQNVYRAQATKDVNAISNRVQKLLLDLGKPQDLITEMDIKLFCKNTHNLQVVRGRSLAQEYNPKTMKFQDIVMHLNNPDSEMVFYVMLRAVDRFYTEFNRFPGYFDDQVEPDIIKLKTCLCRILQEWGCAPLAKDDYVHEMCRYGAAELHSVAAFIGGTGAQEVIKLITGQYVPFNNTFLYNAMTATSATFEL